MQIPRILITAPASGKGKTLITCSILRAFMNRGYHVASFKCGPDYIDPMFHRTVMGVDSYNLDTFLCGRQGVKEILTRHGAGRDLTVIEGVMGYYDGLAGISTDSSAYDVAGATKTPAVLVLDCKGLSVSILPVIQGFLAYKCDSHIQGVILNRLSPMIYRRMKQMIEEQTGVRVYGYLPVLEDCVLESRYLGLKLPQELENIHAQLCRLGEQAEKTIDVDGLIELARSAEELDGLSESAGVSKDLEQAEKLRIGIAQDEAFCFIYQDNLELLEDMGAELIPFSPIHDEQLPEALDGLLLYGGYPELYASLLSENRKMLSQIQMMILDRLPCMAECGGFMYLTDTLEDKDGQVCPMAGVIPGKSYYTGSLRRFGYVTLTEGTVFGQKVGEIPAHEFHYYDSEHCGDAFLAKKPLSERSWSCMVSTETLLAGYPHIHYLGNPSVAKAFLEACKGYRNDKRSE